MFEVTLVVVPPGGGEAEYSLRMQVPALPREGDYLTVIRDREEPVERADVGTEDFIVRRVWWAFHYPDDGALYHEAGEEAPVGEVSGTVSIECEMAKGHYSCDRHVEACGPKAETFEASAY
ncbi:MAG TPA: hypothetical protein VE053_15065 [Allosphingosinicella sp.]|nr:hypothetical protein [Allosphingosinicella sp.]